MPETSSIRTARVVRVLNEFIARARRGRSVPLEVAAHHVGGEPISPQQAFSAPYVPFQIGDAWGPPWGTTWFRLRGSVPGGWVGRAVMVGFRIGNAGTTGFGAEALVWREGRAVQGLSPNHREYLVCEPADGGEEIELFVEAAANPRPPFGANPWPLLLPDPGDDPLFTLERADLHTRDLELESFWHDFRVAVELLTELPVDDPHRSRLLGALDRACNLLNLPDIGDSWRSAEPVVLEALHEPGAPRRHQVSIVGHAHIDTAWLWPMRETVRKCARTFSTVLALMDRYPEYRFTVSSAQHLAWMRDHYPELWSRMKERVAEGRLLPGGSMWVEADCNIPSGESLIRQLVMGKRFFLDELGVETDDVWLPDAFGFSAALPQLMLAANARYFLTQKLSWNDCNVLPHHSFLWEGIDGSRVFAHFPPSDTYNGRMSVRELRHAVSNFKDHDRSTHSLYLFGWGDGGGGPTDAMLESARRLSDVDGLPRLEMHAPREFFELAEREMKDPHTWVGELYLEYHRGAYTSQAKTKRGNRRCELALRDAELWSSLVGSAPYPSGELEHAWRTLLVHQFHDVIPGSGIHWVYTDTEKAHEAVLSGARGMRALALESGATGIDTSGMCCPVVVWNSLSHERCDLVAVEGVGGSSGVRPATVALDEQGMETSVQHVEGDRVVFRASVPACGYRVYDLVAREPRGGPAEGSPGPGSSRSWASSRSSGSAGPAGSVEARDRQLENGRLRVTFDDHGWLASVHDKAADREVLVAGRPANVFRLHPDYPNFYDAWDVESFYRDQVEQIADVQEVEVVERGPVRAAVRIVRSFGSSRIEQLVRLEAESRRIEFATAVDWQETNRLLKVAFPLAVRSTRATYEIQFGHIERPTHENTSWESARFEVCAHKWADVSEPGYGVALLNDCKYGYDVHEGVMSLSLLRAPTWPDPLCDRGRHRFTYWLLPHEGDMRQGGVVEAGYEVNVGLRAVSTGIHHGERPPAASLLSIDARHAVIETVKRSDLDPRDLVVRVYEAWGARGPVVLTAPWSLARASATDLLERELEELQVDGREVRLELTPFRIVTVKLSPATTER